MTLELRAALGRLLAEVKPNRSTSHVRAYAATATLGEATAAASEAAETWLITRDSR